MNENILNAIAEAVMDGDVASTQKNVGAAKEQGIPAERILNDALLKGMNEVGELFRDWEMFVPEVLVSIRKGSPIGDRNHSYRAGEFRSEENRKNTHRHSRGRPPRHRD
ncbi:MAG: B12-binding domain-containing protein [Synergistaceae bacterium]|nr:B12-binding domain-containing protein [Synergistaceae bacterium]